MCANYTLYRVLILYLNFQLFFFFPLTKKKMIIMIIALINYDAPFIGSVVTFSNRVSVRNL